MSQIERRELKKVYPGKKWSERVDKMNDNQIIAIYARLKAERKLGR